MNALNAIFRIVTICICQAATVATLYGWFAVPIGLRPIGWLSIYGFVLLLNSALGLRGANVHDQTTEFEQEIHWKVWFQGVFYQGFLLLTGWLVRLGE